MLTFNHLFISLFALTSSLLLSACGSGSSSDVPVPIVPPVNQQAPLSTQYTGIWQLDSDTFMMLSQSSITTFAFDPNQACYEAGLFNIISSTANTVSSRDIENNEETTTIFAREGDVLKATEAGDTISFQRTEDYPIVSPACSNKNQINSLEVSITLDYLPPLITVNRDAQGTGRPEYRYSLHLDLNKNLLEDNGDMYLQLFHFKGSGQGNFTNNQQVNIEDLAAHVWSLFPSRNTDRFGSTTNSIDGEVSVLRNDNTLTLHVNTVQAAQLAYLAVDTPIKLSAMIDYPQPETEIITAWQDGPWNWTSQRHEDTYPDNGFIAPNSESNHIDARGDFIEGQAQWVDIIEVTFDFQ